MKSVVCLGGWIPLLLMPLNAALWSPEPPPEDGFDWIQLESGEWLKGEIKNMYSDSLEFDSDILDDLVLDFADIRYIRSAGTQMVQYSETAAPEEKSGLFGLPGGSAEKRELVSGKILLDQGSMQVVSGEGDTLKQIQREEIISVSPGEPKELNYWDLDVALGTTFRAGNVNQSDFTLRANLKRRTAVTRFEANLLSTLSENEGETIRDNTRIQTSFDWFRSRNFFWRLATAEYYRDPFQNIDNRITLGSGIGYRLVDRSTFEWSVFGGPAYQLTFLPPGPGSDSQEVSRFTVDVGTDFDWEINDRIDLTGLYQARFGSSTAGGQQLQAITTLTSELTSWIDLDVSVILDYLTDPVPNVDGSLPTNLDTQFVLSLGMDL